MFPLGALIAGDPAGGYQAARLKGQQIDQGDLASAGEKAYGQTLALFSGQVPGAQPMGGPPQAQQQNPLQAIIQRLMGGMQGGQPPQGQPGMPPGGPPPGRVNVQGQPIPQGPPQPSSVPGAQSMNPGAPPGSGMFPTAAQGGNPPGGPSVGQQPLPMPGQGQPSQSLDWRTIVQKVVQANPDNKDPRVIGAAVDRFLPLMNQQSQQQWREISNMMKERALESRERIVGQQIEGRQGVADTQAASREGIAADVEAGRGARATQAEAGREGRAAQSEAGRQGRFDTREGRLSHQATVREDQSWQRLQLQRDNLSRQIEQGGNRQLLGQWRAILDAQHKRAQEIISSQQAGMGGAERKKLLAEEDAFYNEQIKTMKSQMEGGAKPAQPSSEAPAAQEHVNPQTGQVIILKDGAWVDKATGKPIGAGPRSSDEGRVVSDERPFEVKPGQKYSMNDNIRSTLPGAGGLTAEIDKQAGAGFGRGASAPGPGRAPGLPGPKSKFDMKTPGTSLGKGETVMHSPNLGTRSLGEHTSGIKEVAGNLNMSAKDLRSALESGNFESISKDPKFTTKLLKELRDRAFPAPKVIEGGPPPQLENALTEYARGKLTAKEVQKVFKKEGWTVDMRRGRYDFEAFDPDGKAHYLTP